MDEKPKRRWFRFAFSLRTLFIVVTIFCLWLGWQRHIVNERKAILAELRQALGPSQVDFQTLEVNEKAWPATDRWEFARVSTIRRLLGDDSCAQLGITGQIDPTLLARIEGAFPEAPLYARENKADPYSSFRDSLYAPAWLREPNEGTVFKTGLIEK